MRVNFLLISSLFVSTAWAETEQKAPSHAVEKKTVGEAVAKAEAKKPALRTITEDPEPEFNFGSDKIYRIRTFEELNANVIAASHERPIVVDFSMNWCGPCKNRAGEFGSVAEKLSDKDITFITYIGSERGDAVVKAAGVKRYPTWKVYYKGQSVQCEDTDASGVKGCLKKLGYK